MGTAAEPAGEQKHGLWSYPQIKYRGSATPLLGSGGSGNSRSEEHRPGKWSKMQAGLVRWLNMRCTLIPLPCCGACRNRINHSTNHQCTAHVLRREGLQFYGTQNRTSTADAPLYQVEWIAPRWGFPLKIIRPGGLALCVGFLDISITYPILSKSTSSGNT
jgi:hypothetical protein